MKLYFQYGALIAILSQIYFIPGGEMTAPLSLGLVLLGITIRDELIKKPVLLAAIAGGFAAAIRLLLGSGSDAGTVILDSLVVYLLYAALYQLLSGIMGEDYQLDMLFTMLMADMISNLVSLGICGQMNDDRAAWLLIVAAIRSTLVLAISQKNREVQYEKLTSFAANIYADIFFLQKSKRQLDEMTTRSFSIYQALPEESAVLRQQALSLANMGHEVMKDYSNIVSGLAKAIQVTQQESPMLLSQICRILDAGTRETIAPARLRIRLEGDILIEEYYDFFIVLNNLIINAAQAGAQHITAELTAKNRSITMRVSDDASGIPEDILPHIFQPGFSTKFDEETGVPSPGLGLCHVRDIVSKWDAQIEVTSRVGEGTSFRVSIPALGKGNET